MVVMVELVSASVALFSTMVTAVLDMDYNILQDTISILTIVTVAVVEEEPHPDHHPTDDEAAVVPIDDIIMMIITAAAAIDVRPAE